MTATVASGKALTPKLWRDLKTKVTAGYQPPPRAVLEKVRTMMREAVTGGTAKALAGRGNVFGKTGTAQHSHAGSPASGATSPSPCSSRAASPPPRPSTSLAGSSAEPCEAGGVLDEAVARTRVAVRRLLTGLDVPVVGVAVSGGADSLALAAATRHVTRIRVRGLIVDHGLQPGSAQVAANVKAQLENLGLDEVRVLPVTVDGPGGPEAAARRARYAALRKEGRLVLLGHTLDDQAETVLLGLGRGSGPRSIAGMRAVDPPWARPFLAIERKTTRAACHALGLTPWEDPHNSDPAFTRVRLRHEVLPLLEKVLQGGVAEALARTAAQLREDTEALDAVARELHHSVRDGTELNVTLLSTTPPALRRRVLREWLLEHGVNELTDAHLRAVDALIGEWRGQGGVWLPGGLEASRAHGRLRVSAGAAEGS